MTEENAMNGIIGSMANKRYIERGSVSNRVVINELNKNKVYVKIMDVNPIMKQDKRIIFLISSLSFFAFASATRFEITTGIPTCVNVMIKKREGITIIKSPTPSTPMILAITKQFIMT